MKNLKIIVAKLKKEISYEKYMTKYYERVNIARKYAYSNETPYCEVRDEYEDLLLSLYRKVVFSNKLEIINFIKNNLGVYIEEYDILKFKGDKFKFEFTKSGKFVVYAFGKRNSYDIRTAYDIYVVCSDNEIYI